ncbi:MAG: alkaline phosphatase D family protein [Woeseia sp.]
MKLRRRSVLKAILAGVLLVAAGIRGRLATADRQAVFHHGIASGDPTGHSVILWTRVTVVAEQPVRVRWRVSRNREMTRIVAHGRARTDASKDYTVKVDARGLAAGREYYYQFSIDDQHSPVGRTRTLPNGNPESVRLAIVSCANYPAGFFNVYREIAGRSDLHAVVHLGDYIYEYGANGYGSDKAGLLGRTSEPATELLTLADYRMRHAQYKGDRDSQAMLASLPLIAVWDDHEIANDAWRGGAKGHGEDDGEWAGRRDAAIQAYFEWMPIRGRPRGGETRIYREFRFGRLASLIMLDTRLYGRDRQPDADPDVTEECVTAAMENPERRMLGGHQERWFRRRLQRATKTTWQLIGQQVLVAELILPDFEPLIDTSKPSAIPMEQLQRIIERSKNNPPAVLDAWSGYPLARDDFYADLGKYAKNAVILSGDLHAHLAGDLIPAAADRPVAVEFLTGAVSSPVLSDALPEREPNSVRDGVLLQNPWLTYLDIKHRGWLCVTLTDDTCTGEWHLIDTVESRDYRSWLGKTLSVHAGRIGKGLSG